MSLHTILKYFQVIVSVLLILSILVQNRASSLGSSFGGSGEFHITKRGAEKVIYQATVVLAVLFVVSSLLLVFIR